MRKTVKVTGYSHILKYTGLFSGVQGLNILVGMIRNKFVAMILGPEGMGLISLFNSTLTLVSDSTNFGLSISAIRNISEAYEVDDQVKLRRAIVVLRTWTLLTALLGSFLCLILSPLLSDFTFTWGDHTLHFALLSPIVGMMAITASETAILKGTRNLRFLAQLSIYNVFLSLLLSVPLFYLFGEAAIVPSLLIMALVQMILTIGYSYRCYPLYISYRKENYREGLGMIRLGIAYVLAGILGSGADFLIRTYLNTESSLDTVGLYNAGYMMTITYASTVLTAMETDYFPRLSAVIHQQFTMNQTVNRQIEVSFLLLAPIFIFFVVSLPVLLPLLYSGKFLPVLGMMQVMVFAMYLRALRLPIEYLPLAKGHSRSYLFLEAVYDVFLVIFVIIGFQWKGLTGIGVAIFAVGVLDFILVLVYAHLKYAYRLSFAVCKCFLWQFPLCVMAYVLTFTEVCWIYWMGGFLLSIISMLVSVNILRKKTHLWSTFFNKMKGKFYHE